MRTVGEIFKKKRLEKKIDFDKIEKQIKIRKKFLIALEDNNWEQLPSLAYIKGFIRSYSIFLGLNPSEMIAVFRRQFLEKEKKGLLPYGLSTPLNDSGFRLSIPSAAVLALLLFLVVFFGYIFIQYRQLTSPPFLQVISPREGEIFTKDNIQISGKTDSDATVSINNEKIALNQNGKFATNFTLPPGINTIIIEATSKHGKIRQITRTIQVQEEGLTQ